MAENFQLVRDRLRKAANMQKKHYDKRAELKKFNIGDWVLRNYPPNRTRNKLNYRYVGPYLVVEKVGPVNYVLKKSKLSRPMTVHVNDLKEYRGDNAPFNWLEETQGRPVDSQEDMVIEAESTGSETELERLEDDLIPIVNHEAPPLRRGNRVHRAPKRFGWE